MATLPASRVQLFNARALEAARTLVRRNLEPGEFIEGAVHAAPLDPVSARPLVLAMLRRYAATSAWNMSKVVHWAYDGAEEAHEVLGEIVTGHMERGEPVPDILAGYVVEHYHARTAGRPGRDRFKFFPQDVCICMLVLWLCELTHLRPTRSGRSSAKPSACSLIAQALGEAGIHRGGESAVQRIWLNYRDIALGEQQAMRRVISAATAVVTAELQLARAESVGGFGRH